MKKIMSPEPLLSESERMKMLEEEERELETGIRAEESVEPSGKEIEDVRRFPLIWRGA